MFKAPTDALSNTVSIELFKYLINKILQIKLYFILYIYDFR